MVLYLFEMLGTLGLCFLGLWFSLEFQAIYKGENTASQVKKLVMQGLKVCSGNHVGHFEMLKLLESHFLIKEDSQADDIQQYIKGVLLILKLISWMNLDSKNLNDFARFVPLVFSG